ncbi:hypothetical protein L1887_36987 [Cichorium endivia]|nr:hypothetical protein L1887_36987 [Cichorium endivia]
MSEYGELPFDVQVEIMKRLPVKTLIRFRSVSKEWKSLIDSSKFIAAHSLHTQPRHLLATYEYPEEEINYISFVDDETLFQQRPIPNCPVSLKRPYHPDMVGISHGLFCFFLDDKKLAIVWNPSIRKSIAVAVPGPHFVGFGVCRVTTDPKIVAIKQSWDKSNIEATYRCEVMVYTLSSGRWRILSSNLPTKPIDDYESAVAADGFIYWLGKSLSDNMIISFDVTNESFAMIDLPTCLARRRLRLLQFYKEKESLAVLQYDVGTYTVWMMDDCAQRSFIQLFTLQALEDSIKGFRKRGVPILEVLKGRRFRLAVYEPNSQRSNLLQVPGCPLFCTVNSYMETLLLLGRSDCSSY